MRWSSVANGVWKTSGGCTRGLAQDMGVVVLQCDGAPSPTESDGKDRAAGATTRACTRHGRGGV
eukprot:27550_2